MRFFSHLQQLGQALFQRRQPVVNATQPGAFCPQQHERALLDLFARGFLTIDQVMERLSICGTPPASR